MSRVAKYPVELPKGVEVTLGAAEVAVKGPLGTLKQTVLPCVSIEKDGDKLQVKAGEHNRHKISQPPVFHLHK